MKRKNMLLAVVLAGSNAVSAQTPPLPETDSAARSVAGADTENKIDQIIDKTVIIESLQAIRKDPSSVKFHSAMCYDMAMPSLSTTFSCPDCGSETQYYRESFAGKVADHMPSLLRSLKTARIKIDVDFSDFCSKCSANHGTAAELRFTSHCVDCRQTFNWKATSIDEIDQLKLLFVEFPVTDIDQGHIGSQLIEPEKLSEYLAQRFLCPTCRDRHGLK